MRRATGFTLLELLAVITVFGFAVYKAIEVSKRNAFAARAAAEPWRLSPKWVGTKLTGDAPQHVRAAFEADPPAPEERKAKFAKFLPGKKYYCVGWYGTIDAVAPIENGWDVTLKIGCQLRGGGVPYCSSMTTETWRVFKSGAARCVKCDAGAPVGIESLIVD